MFVTMEGASAPTIEPTLPENEKPKHRMSEAAYKKYKERVKKQKEKRAQKKENVVKLKEQAEAEGITVIISTCNGMPIAVKTDTLIENGSDVKLKMHRIAKRTSWIGTIVKRVSTELYLLAKQEKINDEPTGKKGFQPGSILIRVMKEKQPAKIQKYWKNEPYEFYVWRASEDKSVEYVNNNFREQAKTFGLNSEMQPTQISPSTDVECNPFMIN